MKILVLPLLLISLVLCSAFLVDIANANYAPAPSPDGSMCGSKCDNRCSNNWRKKLCMKLCMICCGKCNCVPSGPKADKAECPCYRDMKNPKGHPKCP